MSHQIIPEMLDGKWSGRMLHLNENGEQVDPMTESVVQGTDAVMLELEQPKIIEAPVPVVEDSPAAVEVAPSSDEG